MKSNDSFPVRLLGVVIGGLLLLAALATAARGSLADCYDATCRISAGQGQQRNLGTGCAFNDARGHICVLTCAHLVEKYPTVLCEFFTGGHKSQPLAGRVIAKDTATDSAIVVIPRASFGGRLPTIIPLAPRDYMPKQSATLSSVGCPGASWATAWRGHCRGYFGHRMAFFPPPADGRSGSAIFDGEGTMIVALLFGRATDDSQGMATPVGLLDRVYVNRVSWRPTQCAGRECQVLPWNKKPPQQPQTINVWPTAPQTPVDAPPAASVDLSPLTSKLDKIAELLEKRFPAEAAAPELPMIPAPVADRESIDPDAIVEEAAREAATATEAAISTAVQPIRAELQGEIDTAKEERGRLATLVGNLAERVGDVGDLKDRVDARLEKISKDMPDDASIREKARAYAKDYVGEKLDTLSGTSSLTIGKVVAGSLGLSGPLSLALGIGLMGLRRRIRRRITEKIDAEGNKEIVEVEE